MSRVKQVLKESCFNAVEDSLSVAQVAQRMAELNIGAILLLQDGVLKGIFSERDLMTKVVVPGRDPALTPVSEVMSTQLTTVSEEATLEEAMEHMHAHSCRHLPVMRGDQLVGFLSMRDVMHFELASKDEELHHMRAYIHGSA